MLRTAVSIGTNGKIRLVAVVPREFPTALRGLEHHGTQLGLVGSILPNGKEAPNVWATRMLRWLTDRWGCSHTDQQVVGDALLFVRQGDFTPLLWAQVQSAYRTKRKDPHQEAKAELMGHRVHDVETCLYGDIPVDRVQDVLDTIDRTYHAQMLQLGEDVQEWRKK